MLSSSIIHLNKQASITCDRSTEPVVKQEPALGNTANSGLRLSCWLAALILGLASSPAASAAPTVSENKSRANAEGLIKTEVAKEPSSFPALSSAEVNQLWVQQPSIELSLSGVEAETEAETTAIRPESSPLPNENLRTNAADLTLEAFEFSAAKEFANPASFSDFTRSEVELGFPDSAAGEEALGIDSMALSSGEETPTHVFSAAIASTDLIAQAAASADEIPWRFSFEPFFYVPFGANGDITVRGINAPINAGIGDIFSAIVNDLNFAAFGRVEAWKGQWGVFFNGAYMNLGTGRAADIPVPPALQQAGLPPQVSVAAAAGTSFVQLDLGGAYRFGDGNLPTALRTADTEFDLGPFIFDALAGLRLYSFSNDLVLTSSLGNRFEFGQSQTVLEPMIGGRARWNLSHNLAALAGASISGFSIGDLTLSVAGYAGIDWLFSGNTSLLVSYGFTYLDYSSGNSGINLFTHGPNLGVKFRF